MNGLINNYIMDDIERNMKRYSTRDDSMLNPEPWIDSNWEPQPSSVALLTRLWQWIVSLRPTTAPHAPKVAEPVEIALEPCEAC